MNFCLTNAGKEYMAKVNAGEVQMHLTRAVTGSGNSSYLDILTSVVDEKQQIQIDAVRSEGEYTYIECVVTNLELEEEYVLRQIGLYATDDSKEDDKLIIIGQDKYGDRIPVLAEKEVEYQYNIGMRVSNAAEVTFDFSVNDFVRKKLFYEHLEEYEQYKKDIQDQFTALPKVKIGPKEDLDRKDTILFETLKDSNKVTKIRERDSKDVLHEYELAAVFEKAKQREELQSDETLSILFGKIKKYFADLKAGCFIEADNPFVLMTETTYKPINIRTEGSLYGLIAKERGLVIIFFDRYVPGTEEPSVENTMYGIASTVYAGVDPAENPYKGILNNLVFIEENEDIERQQYMLYGTNKLTR